MRLQIGNRIKSSPSSFSGYRTRYACNDEGKLGPVPQTAFFREVEQNALTRNIYPLNRLHDGAVVRREATTKRPRRTVHGQGGLENIFQPASFHQDRVASHSMAFSWSVCDAEIRSTGGLEAEEPQHSHFKDHIALLSVRNARSSMHMVYTQEISWPSWPCIAGIREDCRADRLLPKRCRA